MDDRLIPAGETEFARDASFGYHSSDLRKWVEEKTGRAVSRRGTSRPSRWMTCAAAGRNRFCKRLQHLQRGQMCVVNAASYRDLEVLVLALLQAESQGKHFIFRTAASFVRVRAGILPQALLERESLAQTTVRRRIGGGGLTRAAQHRAIRGFASAAQPWLKWSSSCPTARSGKAQGNRSRGPVEKSRLPSDLGWMPWFLPAAAPVQGSDGRESLEISQIVSASLVELVRELPVRPRFLVAKGGITSSDIATQGLGVQRAIVLGQILPGVPVWQLGPETRFEGLPYVIFPGNVGDENALLEIVVKLPANKINAEGSETQVIRITLCLCVSVIDFGADQVRIIYAVPKPGEQQQSERGSDQVNSNIDQGRIAPGDKGLVKFVAQGIQSATQQSQTA